jgi:REP element-mobilizing transposase RayT
MGIRRANDIVVYVKYNLIWIPECGKHKLIGKVAQYTKKEVPQRIAEEYGMLVDTIEVMENHLHVFLK